MNMALVLLELQQQLLELDIADISEWRPKHEHAAVVDVSILPVGQLRPMRMGELPIGGCDLTLANGFVLQVQYYFNRVTVHYVDEATQRYNSATALGTFGATFGEKHRAAVARQVMAVIPAVIDPFI